MTKMLIKLITFLYVFVVYVNITNAEPITFRGVNMAMQGNDVVDTLKSKNFKCEKKNNNTTCYTDERYNLFPDYIIKIVTKDYPGPENDRIVFGCNTYRGCSYSFNEVLSSVSKFTGVSMDDFEEFQNELGRCGRGEDGDKICVMDSKKVIIFRGSLGGGGMSLD